ncbi:MAG: glycosyltransferase [Ferrimicrobium sp.]
MQRDDEPQYLADVDQEGPRVSVIVTAYNEGDHIRGPLERLLEAISLPAEVVVVVDSELDSSIPVVQELAKREPRLRLEVNTFGPGPARAIRYGFAVARAEVVVVTMADGCDDPYQIGDLVRLVERGVVIAAASRYAVGGKQIGAPVLKGLMSRAAGTSLGLIGRVGTLDATNSFKAYSREFVSSVGIESDGGFEVGIELVAKARRLRLPVAELPTIWLERSFGESNFRLSSWLLGYLHWYRYAFGKRLSLEELKELSGEQERFGDGFGWFHRWLHR